MVGATVVRFRWFDKYIICVFCVQRLSANKKDKQKQITIHKLNTENNF